jgi:hypothetical protein
MSSGALLGCSDHNSVLLIGFAQAGSAGRGGASAVVDAGPLPDTGTEPADAGPEDAGAPERALSVQSNLNTLTATQVVRRVDDDGLRLSQLSLVPTATESRWFVRVRNTGPVARCLSVVELVVQDSAGTNRVDQELLVFAPLFLNPGGVLSTVICVAAGEEGIAHSTVPGTPPDPATFARAELRTRSRPVGAAQPDVLGPVLNAVEPFTDSTARRRIKGLLTADERGFSDPTVDFFLFDAQGYVVDYLVALGLDQVIAPGEPWYFETSVARAPISTFVGYAGYTPLRDTTGAF